jgi:hypothetical protein
VAFYVRHRRSGKDVSIRETEFGTAFDAVFEAGRVVADFTSGDDESWDSREYVIEVLVGDEENREVIFSHEYRA